MAQLRQLIAGIVLLGVGLGGFFDGIVFHQILQWHHMLSSKLPPTSVVNIEINTFADGVFHAVAWVVTLAGVAVTIRAVDALRAVRDARLLGRFVVGGLLAGWGAFNTIEGLVDHEILGIHHVRAGPDEVLYDVAFLAWGAVMLVVGVWLLRRTVSGVSQPRS